MRRLLLVLAVVALAAACTQEKVDEAQVGVYYTDGPIEGRKFDKVLEPGDSAWVFNDHVYRLPARQITFISSGGEEADAGPLTFRAKGGEELQVELTTRFFLNSDRNVIRQFFLEICQKFNCWEGATSGGKVKTNDGWGRMLRETIGNPQQAVVRDVGLEFSADAIRYDNETRDAFATAFAQGFADAQKNLLGGKDYFCGPGYERGSTKCPNIAVEITSVRYTNNDLETQREQRELAAQREQTAIANEAAAKAEQRVIAAKATPELQAYNEAQAILECAKRPECTMIIQVGDEKVPVVANAG